VGVCVCESRCAATDTGWRIPIGCLKLEVIFRKRAPNYRALLRKMTYEDKASYDSTPRCGRNVVLLITTSFHVYTPLFMYIRLF